MSNIDPWELPSAKEQLIFWIALSHNPILYCKGAISARQSRHIGSGGHGDLCEPNGNVV